MCVLSSLKVRPLGASHAVNRALTSSACARLRHNAMRSSAYLTLIFHRSSQTLYSDSETVLSRVDRTRRPAVEVWVAALGRRVGLKCQSKMTSGMAAPSLG